MVSKFFKIFVTAGVFGFLLFEAGFCLAIGEPVGLDPCPEIDLPLAVDCDWDDVSGADHYELYYREAEEEEWTDRYPDVSHYMIVGLTPDTTYEWYVVSCGDPDCSESANSVLCSFTTEEMEIPENGNGNGHGGAPIDLINPLKCDTLECALEALFNFLFFLAMALGPLLIIYAAFLILTAAGNPERVNRGKTIIFWTLIALAIVLLAKGAPSIMKGVFGG